MQERLRQERIRNRLGGKGCQLSRWQAEYFLATKNKPVIGSGLRSALCPAGLYALSFSRSMHNIKAGTPRIIGLQAREYHEALQKMRARQATEEFRESYAARAGIESTHAQAIRCSGVAQE